MSQASNIESVLVENRVFPPDARAQQGARISGMAAYDALCAEAAKDPDAFWARLARENLSWTRPFTRTLDESNAPFYQWFGDGELNASANCLDKHMGTPVEHKTAIVFEADDGSVTTISYRELLTRVSQFANALKAEGIQKGDRVIVYMPMTIEGVIAMQACARIGATHSVVFGGFSAKALQERIIDAGAVAVITANYQLRGGKELPLKAIVDDGIAMGGCESIKSVLVYERTLSDWKRVEGRDKTFTEALNASEGQDECVPEPVGAEHPLFILYTSGSTGKPKGVQHATGGYLLWAKLTMDWTFDLRPDDVFWCTADIGWITGHTYVAYGPLAAGATQVIFEGIPTFPHAGRFWQMIEKHKVSIFYTAPTAIRSLIKAAESDEKVHPKNWDLSSLRILGSVGEPINPEAWMWYHRNIGHEKCPIVDTFWQTETGGHVITPLPGATPLVPGSCTLPLPGIAAAIVDETGKDLPNGAGGMLVIKRPWPSMIRTIWNDPERFKKSYFPEEMGGTIYLAGDGAVRSEDRGYFRITGRIDDVLNVSGHRLGTMEIESALVAKTDLVAEAAVVGRPDDVTGEAVCAFVVLKRGRPTSDEESMKLAAELRAWVAKEIGPIAKPKDIRFGENLPKTRSGKIMRRLLRSIAKGEAITQDTSTLENPAILEQLGKAY
ncbi:acetate--CoA ligase [Variovorax guangxiensis]|uniref:Acetyl-coenzyme A synthetase n=1 Tax=Variovorax guangxiensis TaxID=1775474 RepID=A0A502E1E5_9BURK|nr:acetate--CoA ligase [Variovorax guangxiensis]TPG27021.1 acetate--CoA ligase [Variovorax ginsengisoli]TPG30749.1 acetate--CoA ligase [Variovorax guangxiensis]